MTGINGSQRLILVTNIKSSSVDNHILATQIIDA